MDSVTEKMIMAHGDDVDPENTKSLNRELLKAFQGILNVRIRRSKGDYSAPDEELIRQFTGIPMLKQPPQEPTQVANAIQEQQKEVTEKTPIVRFTEVLDRYLVEVEKGESWTEKTKAESYAIEETVMVRQSRIGSGDTRNAVE